jgi:serine/threonine protein kinase
MLEIDPDERYSAEDILSHEFLDEIEESKANEKELVSPATTYAGCG